MSERVRITLLVENSVYRMGLRAEHGLCCHLQFGRHSVLFDTGQSGLLLENASPLHLDLRRLDAVVLSHGHHDHCGGLCVVASLCPHALVFLHPAATTPKYSHNHSGPVRFIGMSETAREIVRTRARVTWTPGMSEVVPGLYVTGQIPRRTPYEDVGGRFFLDAAGQQPDALLDDQALFFASTEGVVVLLGCAHAGVVNTLQHIEQLTGGARIHTVLGGLHLLQASEQRMRATLAALEQRGIQRIVPAHCTGGQATAALLQRFGERCTVSSVGQHYDFTH